MKSEGATAIRNVGFLLVQRVLKVLQALLFLILVPRLLGPDRYGLFRLLMSLSLWFIFATSMGMVPVFSRFLPQLTLEKKNLKDFFEPLLNGSSPGGPVGGLAILTFYLLLAQGG